MTFIEKAKAKALIAILGAAVLVGALVTINATQGERTASTSEAAGSSAIEEPAGRPMPDDIRDMTSELSQIPERYRLGIIVKMNEDGFETLHKDNMEEWIGLQLGFCGVLKEVSLCEGKVSDCVYSSLLISHEAGEMDADRRPSGLTTSQIEARVEKLRNEIRKYDG